MSALREALIEARDWIANDHAELMSSSTLPLPSGEPDMTTIDDESAAFFSKLDGLLARIDAALLADGWERPDTVAAA